MTEFHVAPGGALRGRLRLPGDKSISHRALMLAALAEGDTRIEGFLEASDTLATLAAMRALGATVQRREGGELQVHGVGPEGLREPPGALDLGNSGTGMRLLAGLLAGQRFASTLCGDPSLSRRPMRRIAEPLGMMGALLSTSEGGTAPLHLEPAPEGLRAIDYALPVPSAQVKSCILLAGLFARGVTRVRELVPTRDHTERMLESFQVVLERYPDGVGVRGGQRLRATDLTVPVDISSAAFFLVGASIAEGSDLVIEGVGINPTRTAVLDILRAMGADVTVVDRRMAGAEPVADLRVRHAPLHGIRIPAALVPSAIDEFPAIFVAAACARGETELTGAAELRVKESDRIAAMERGLRALGIDARATSDGMVVRGGRLSGGVVESLGDHRIAMALAMAGLCAGAPLRVLDCANVGTSFPGFAALAARAGLRIEESGA